MRRAVLALALLLLAGAAAGRLAGAAEEPTRGLRYPSLTPDGRQVVFAYRGDIWIAPVDGKGPSRRLTVHEAQDTLPRTSPDGKWVAFSSRRNGGYDIFVVSVDGGVPRQVTQHAGPAILCDWSPDGKRILFLSARRPSLTGMDLFEVGVDGGTPRAVTLDGGRDGAYLSDGKGVVYARGFNTIYQDDYEGTANYDLFRVSEPGALPVQLSTTVGNERHPFASADGKTVYFVAEEKGVANFYAVPVEGGERRKVTEFREDVWRPDLAWDGKTAVFETGGRLATVDLTQANPKATLLPILVQSDVRHSGVEVRRISSGADQLHLSPDGGRLAFTALGDLWIVPASGGDATRLTSTDAKEEWPRFSPDGKQIAFQSDEGGESNLYLLDLATKAVKRLTDHKANDFFHAWSPDGRRLVFTSERGGDRDLWILDLDSLQTTQLTRHAAVDDDAAFSPDGRLVAFDSAREGNQAIFVMPADGQGEPWRVSEGGGFYQVPTWSPDGSMIAFEAFNPATGGSDGIFVASARGGAQVRVTRDGAGPCWSPRGDFLYFTLNRGGTSEIGRHPAPRSVDQTERIPFVARVEVDLRKELGVLFDEIWAQLGEGFYDPKMHGVDWEAMKKKYRPLALDAEIKDEFHNVVRQMLAELKASHLGISGGDETGVRANPSPVERGQLGMELDPNPAEGGGRKVIEVVPGGPADKAGLRVGDLVVGLGRERVKAGTNLDPVLAGTGGKDVSVAFRPLTGEGLGTERTVAVRAASWREMAQLVYLRWVESCDRTVREATKGRAGYVHLSMMDGENLQRFQQAVAGWLRNPRVEGMVLDVRNNGGGNIHFPLMEILTTRPFLQVQPRGAPARVTQPSLYWDKPVVVLVNERSFSDAEVFPDAFRTSGRGKIVGVPTAGGVIGTNDITLSDGSTLRIPRVGYFRMDGTRLEGVGVPPDVLVVETPEDRRTGRDPQLEAAVKVILEEMDAAKAAKAKPTPRAAPPEVRPTPAPPAPPPPATDAGADPLRDVAVGEWVRYRVTFGGSETVVRYEVVEVTPEVVRLRRTVESGGAFLPPIPEEVRRRPIAELLGELGALKGTRAVPDGVVVDLEWQGAAVSVTVRPSVPVLGIAEASANGAVVLSLEGHGGPGSPAAAVPAEPPAAAAPAEPPADDGAVENPLYDAKVGEWARYRVLAPGGELLDTEEVVEASSDEIVVVATIEQAGQRTTGPTLRRPRTPTLPLAERQGASFGHETVEVAGRKLSCVVVTVPMRRGGTLVRHLSTEVPVTGVVRETRNGTLVRELVDFGAEGPPPAS